MGDAFLDTILERVAREQRAGMRIGTLTAIDAGNASVTVSLASGSVPGIRWLGPYSPVVGDMVVVSWVQDAWVVLGKLSKQLTAPTVIYRSVELSPSAAWVGTFAEDVWSWQVAPTSGIYGGPPAQGKRWPSGVEKTNAGIWRLPALVGSMPVGATVTSAKLRLVRWTPSSEQETLSPEVMLVTPRLYTHAYSAPPGGGGAPSWSSTVWSPGSLARGESAGWDLPSAWLTALLAGTALGVGVDSTTAADWTRWASLRLDLSYSVPA